ncbi:MAG TPA: purine-nucleoside phosphorylase [Bacteroidia bacterium]|nr:purine-nucleoside phosphorylase [Bacteroidia bacterium]
MSKQIKATADFLKKASGWEPEIGIILGSGLGGLANAIQKEFEIPYHQIPNFPVSTVKGHGSKMTMGILGGKKVVALQGRFHFYEGYSMEEVVFPVRVLRYLGVQQLLLSNASGGLRPGFQVGDLMILDDHINLMGVNPLIGHNEEELGPRFPDMSAPYDQKLIKKAQSIAVKQGFRCHTGVYAAVTGPCYETPAEYRYIRTIGADAVGMSTVPEVIAARHMGLSCFAVSVITDLGGMDQPEPLTHDEVVHVASLAEAKLTTLIETLISES